METNPKRRLGVGAEGSALTTCFRNALCLHRASLLLAALILTAALPAHAQKGDRKWEEQSTLPSHLKSPPSPALSPQEALRTFRLPKGFRIELVAHDPMVQDPVAISFDEDGRLWVAEMRGYMQDLKNAGEHDPIGRVSVLEDLDGDGVMDRSTVFLDQLVLPRAIANVKGGALIADHRKLMFAEDRDGDGRADRVKVVDPDYSGAGNVEHSPNGLLRGLDNWYYNAKSKSRYRLRGSRWIEEETEFRGQWGITQDDFGRLFYNYNWDQLRGDFVPPNCLNRNPHHEPSTGVNERIATNQTVHPIRMNTGVNRGYRPGVLDEAGKLYEFASACAPLIYRGELFPEEFRGNAFVCGPGANIVKRNILVEDEDGIRVRAKDAYPDRDFLASTDERFRPVNLANGPDGAFYVVDMYRGIIQHRDYMTTHLRDEILARKLEEPIHLGRIYRVVSTAKPRRAAPKMARATNDELVELLDHENGWTRDTAQRLLVERDATEAADALADLALSKGSSWRARVHALWTLKGLEIGGWGEGRLWNDDDARVRIQALLAMGSAARASRHSRTVGRMWFSPVLADDQPRVALQQILSFGWLSGAARSGGASMLLHGSRLFGEDPLFRDAVLSGLEDREWSFLELCWDQESNREQSPGNALLIESLASATIASRRKSDIRGLVAKLNETTAEEAWKRDAILTGLSVSAGRRDGKPMWLWREPDFLKDIASVEDRQTRWRLERAKKLFSWPGHDPGKRSRSEVKPLTPAQEDLFSLGRQKFLLTCAPCHGAEGKGMKPLGPPLLDSDWVLGTDERLMRIVLHGLEGPVHVNGREYAPPDILPNMPSVGVMTSEELAAILTYIRRAWGHEADPVAPHAVTRVRDTNVDRTTPWTEKELLEIE